VGKRSSFERRPQDTYDTPYKAVLPLLPFLEPKTVFLEPCAGAYDLVNHLQSHGHQCVFAGDVRPRDSRVNAVAEDFRISNVRYPVITNPPWDREILHDLIERWRHGVAYSWLLLDADWAFTIQAAPYMKYCSRFVAVGRIKWIPGSKHTGKENCAWYRLENRPRDTMFYGREVRG